MKDKEIEVMKAFAMGETVVMTIPKSVCEKLSIRSGTFIKIRVEGKNAVLEVVN